MRQRRAILLNSGGFDSYVVGALLRQDRPSATNELHSLFVDYGQRPARQEGRAARYLARAIGARHHKISLSLPFLRRHALITPDEFLIHGSPEVVQDGLPTDNLVSWNVPLRNFLLVTLAASLGQTLGGVDELYTGFGDHTLGTVPDQVPTAHTALLEIFRTATLPSQGIAPAVPQIFCPLAGKTKAEALHFLATTFPSLDFVAKAWSCYNSEFRRCGVCGACTVLRDAYIELGYCDPFLYLTPNQIERICGVQAHYIPPQRKKTDEDARVPAVATSGPPPIS